MSAGVDSLASVLIVQALSSESGLEIPPTIIFDHATLDSVAHFVSTETQRSQAGAYVMNSNSDLVANFVPAIEPTHDRIPLVTKVNVIPPELVDLTVSTLS